VNASGLQALLLTFHLSIMPKNLPLLIGLLATGLVAGLVLSELQQPNAPAASTEALSPGSLPDSAVSDEERARANAERDDMALELAGLRARVEQLENPRTRSAATETDETQESVVFETIPNAGERAKILAVMEAVEEERRHERDLRRTEKQAAEFLRQATRIAERLSLPTGSEDRIASILITEREKVALVREQYRDVSRDKQGRTAYRDALRATSAWRQEELARYFGPEIAESISASEDKRARKKNDKDRSGKKKNGKTGA
jgi:hypothetical protein